MTKFYSILICFVFAVMVTTGQKTTDTLKNGIVVTQDDRLDWLIKKQFELNEKANFLKDKKGYRINVLITDNKEEAISAKKKLLQLYPDHKVYLIYQSPYFKLRFGNFKTTEDAEKLKKQLSKLFKGGVFIIPDKIELTWKKTPEDGSNN